MHQTEQPTSMVTYQFKVDDDEWNAWKRQVPRDKTLDTRIRELLEADREGRVLEPEPEPTHVREEEQRTPEPVETSPLDGVDFPGTVTRDEAIEAINAAHEYLREHGKAKRKDFVRDVMPKFPMSYEVREDPSGYKGGWWRSVVKPGLEALDDVKKPPSGASDWRLV